MKHLLGTIACIILLSTIAQAQNDDFRFNIGGKNYFKIWTNANDIHLFGTNNAQSSMFMGFNAGRFVDTSGVVTNGGEFNMGFGNFALEDLTTGQRNSSFGFHSLKSVTTGNNNIAMGAFSAISLTTGGRNIAIGDLSLRDAVGGNDNTAIGHNSLVESEGQGNTALGVSSGLFHVNSNRNTYVGLRAGAGGSAQITPISNNVMLGAESGQTSVTSGSVLIGYRAGRTTTTNNQLYITNTEKDSLNALIYGDFGTENLKLNAEVSIDDNYILPKTQPGFGQVLQNLSGGPNPQLTWSTIHTPWINGSGSSIYSLANIGVGAIAGAEKLAVKDQDNNHVASFINSEDSGPSDGIYIIAGDKSKPTGDTHFIDFRSGNGAIIGFVNGDATGGVNYMQTSDRRLKTNIQNYDKGLETVMAIRPTIYQRKVNPGPKEIGFIAQELKTVIPSVVAGDETSNPQDAPMAVDYGRITPVLVAAIQEQQQMIEQLKKEIEELKANAED